MQRVRARDVRAPLVEPGPVTFMSRTGVDPALGGGHGDPDNAIQGSIERTASVSKVVFNAPPVLISYGYVVAAAALLGLFLSPDLDGLVRGLLLIGVPALVAGPLSAPLARRLGGTLYYKRAAFLA